MKPCNKINYSTQKEPFWLLLSKRIDNNKEFCKTVKLLFSNKNPMRENIILIEDSKILSNEAEVAEYFNEYFCNITNSFDIDPTFKEVQEEKVSVKQMVLRAINTYKDYPSIRVNNEHATPNVNAFQFSHVNPNKVMRQIDLQDTIESNNSCVTPRILKAMNDIGCLYLTDCIALQFMTAAFLVS